MLTLMKKIISYVLFLLSIEIIKLFFILLRLIAKLCITTFNPNFCYIIKLFLILYLLTTGVKSVGIENPFTYQMKSKFLSVGHY
jgi:hypothetical protein